MIPLDFSSIELTLKKQEGKTFVQDPVRKKWVVLNPEEHVRQYLLQYVINIVNYPKSLIAVEKQITLNQLKKRFDIVVFDGNHKPWMIIECKAPEVAITETTLNQVLQYHNNLQAKYWVLSNGHQNFCARINGGEIEWLNELPSY